MSEQLPGSRGRHPEVLWDDCCRVRKWSHPPLSRLFTQKSLNVVKFSLLKCLNLSFLLAFHCDVFSVRSISASLFVRTPLMNSMEQWEKVPLKPLGSTHHNYAYSSWQRQMREPLKFPLFFTVRPDQSVSMWPQRSLQAGRSFAANLGPSQSAQQQRECWTVVDNLPWEQALSCLWFINSPTNSSPASKFISFVRVCVFSLKPKDPWQQCSCRPPTTCLIWSKGSCFTLLSADTMRTTMSGHIMYSRKGTLQENKWTYVKLFNQGTYPKLTQNIVKH